VSGVCIIVVVDDVQGRCVACDAECLRCTDVSSVCTQCVDGFELFARTCIVPCRQSQFRADDGRYICTSYHSV